MTGRWETGHTPTPWKVEENCLGVYPISAKQGPISVQPAKAFGESDAIFIVTAVNAYASNQARIEELEGALRYALPLAKLALEQYRQERLRCGHSFGTKQVGLYDSEVLEMEKHSTTLSKGGGSK